MTALECPCPCCGFLRERHACYDSLHLYEKLMHRFNIRSTKHKTQNNCVISTRPYDVEFGTNVRLYSSDEEFKGHFFLMQEILKTKQNN